MPGPEKKCGDPHELENDNELDPESYLEPEDFGQEPERPRGPLAQFPSLRHAVPAFFLFFIFYIATVVYTQYPQGEYLWLSGESLFVKHQYWRLATSIITHADLLHLISNAPIFLIFGWMIQAYFGSIAFPLVSFIIGLATNFLTVFMYEPNIRLIGASGMAYGMVSFWLVLYIKHDTDHTIPVRIIRAVGFALVMMLPSTFDPYVSYMAHAIGFGIGLVAGILLIPVIPVREPK